MSRPERQDLVLIAYGVLVLTSFYYDHVGRTDTAYTLLLVALVLRPFWGESR